MHMAYHNTAGPTLFSLAERSCDLVCQTDEFVISSNTTITNCYGSIGRREAAPQ